MNLPPTIEALIHPTNPMVSRECAQRIAHEACRLQRKADTATWARYYHGNPAPFDEASDAPFTDPLVVELP